MKSMEEIISGGDLRSIEKSNSLIRMIRTQSDFDALFSLLFHSNRIVVMRAADSIEKITVNNPAFLQRHKEEMLRLSSSATDRELLWHLAQVLPRVTWNSKELKVVWQRLSDWALDKQASRIVRVNALQGMADLLPKNPVRMLELNRLMDVLNKENIPSIRARIRMLQRRLKSQSGCSSLL